MSSAITVELAGFAATFTEMTRNPLGVAHEGEQKVMAGTERPKTAAEKAIAPRAG